MQLVQTASSALRNHLDTCGTHAPEFDHGLSDHLPMQLHVMHALGASGQRLAGFARLYAQRLEPRQRVETSAASWLALRGRIEAFDTLEGLFSSGIAQKGRDAVLRELLPALMPGAAGGAFHGLIRCGHAVAANHDGELAMGLAYWAAGWLPLLPYAESGKLPAPAYSLAAWAAHAHDLTTTADTEPPRIVLRMKAWATARQFPALAPALQADEATLGQIARFAAMLYAQTGNFTVMHMLTSVHALLVLRPWLVDGIVATRWFGVSLFAAFRAARLSREQLAAAGTALVSASPAAGLPVRDWDALAAEAIASNDDHAAKIVYSSRALYEMFGDAVFHAAATRGVFAQA